MLHTFVKQNFIAYNETSIKHALHKVENEENSS